MGRRKGESAGRLNERDFPHLVELAVPPGGFQDQDQEFDAFHRERGVPIRPGAGRYEEGQFYVRFCFPRADLAYAFRARFGGEYLTYPPKRLKHVTLRRPPEEIERMRQKLLNLEKTGAISGPVHELIENLCPEPAPKLPPKDTT